MLTAKEIGAFIAQPELVAPNHLEDLKELTDKHPHSQLFSMLYLQGLSANNSLDFESALKEHSYRISDRAQLYRLIHDFENSEVETEAISETTAELKPEPQQEEPSITLENNIQEETSILNEPVADAPSPVEETTAPEPPSNLDETDFQEAEGPLELEEVTEVELTTDPSLNVSVGPDAEELIKVEPETLSETLIEIPDDPLDESILHHAVANNYRLEELTEEEEASLSQKDIIEEEIDLSNDSVELDANPEIELIAIDSEQTFTGWLRADTNYSEPDFSEEASIHSVVEDFSEFDPMETLYGEIEKPKKEFFSPTKKAKESLQEDQLPVSETLAKIYIMQGNYPKAIAAYEELSLSFPEKKIFFANLIEDLQKKLNK